MLLFDREENRWRLVSDEDAGAAISSGRFAPPKDEPLYLLAPDGGRHTATYEGALQALQQGWRLEPEADRRRAYLEKEYGGLTGTLQAGLGGLISGASVGASDALLRLAPETADSMALAKEVNPWVWGASEAVGIIGPTLASGGTAGVARGATAAARTAAKVGAEATAKRMLGVTAGKAVAQGVAKMTPAYWLGRSGRAVAEGVAKATGRGVETVLPRVVAGVAEAVPATVGLTLGNAVLENKPLTAEVLVANVGLSAAIAGGFPFIAAAVHRPFSALAPDVARVARKVAGDGHLADPADLAVENRIASWIIKKAAPASHFLSERPQEFIEELAKKDVRFRAVQELSEIIEKHTKGVVGAVNTADDVLERFRAAWGRGVKAKLLAKDFEAVDAVAAADEAVGVMGRIREDIADYFKRVKSEGGDVGLASELNALNRELNASIKRIHGRFAQNPSSVELAQSVFREVDELKRGLQRRIAARAPHVRKAGRMGDWEALELISAPSSMAPGRQVEGIEARLRGFLEETQRWGRAGEKQREVNAAYARMLGRDEILRKHFVKVGDHDFLPQFKADDVKFRSLIGDSHHETNLRFDEVEGYYRNLDNLADVFARNFDDEALQVAAASAKQQASVVQKALAEARKDVSAIQTLQSLDKVSGGVMTSAVTAGIVGYHMFGPAGAVGGFLLGGLARPGVLIRRLATIERAMVTFRRSLSAKTAASLQGHFDGSPLALPRTAPPISIATVSYARKRKSEDESRRDAARRLRSELLEDPTNLVEKLSAHLEDIQEFSPDVAGGISNLAGRAYSFLRSKALEVFGDGRSGALLQKEQMFSESQLRKWERYVLTVENPFRTIDQLFRGFISPEEAETLRVVYPALHAEVADVVMEELSRMKHAPPRATVIQLTQFLGIPVDVTASPLFAQRMAARDMQNQAPQITNPEGHAGTTNRPPPSTKVAEKENVYYSHATTSQRLVG